MTLHITVPLPDNVSINTARRIAVECEAAVNRATGALVDANITDLNLTEQERRTICAAIEAAWAASNHVDATIPGTSAIVNELLRKLNPDKRSRIVTETVRDGIGNCDELSRPQETAADAMAGEYGRSRVRHLGDGAVVITGMTGEYERRSVCIERDGRERWRS